jgi:hypothetical protein
MTRPAWIGGLAVALVSLTIVAAPQGVSVAGGKHGGPAPITVAGGKHGGPQPLVVAGGKHGGPAT